MKTFVLCLMLLLCIVPSADAALPKKMQDAIMANDYATFVEEAEKIPDGDARLADALCWVKAGLKDWHPMGNLTGNPMTDLRAMEYLLSRGAGDIMMKPTFMDAMDCDHYDKLMPASMVVLYDITMSYNNYPALLIVSHCDIREYVNTPMAPKGKTLLYLALERERPDVAYLLLLCGADASINPTEGPSLEEMLKISWRKQTRKDWKKLLKARKHQRVEDDKYGLDSSSSY